jgi:hypothetical protein
VILIYMEQLLQTSWPLRSLPLYSHFVSSTWPCSTQCHGHDLDFSFPLPPSQPCVMCSDATSHFLAASWVFMFICLFIYIPSSGLVALNTTCASDPYIWH